MRAMCEIFRKAGALCLAAGLSACAAPSLPVNRPAPPVAQPAPPPALPRHWREQRMAQREGLAAHGRRTASGEVHDMYALSAAHPTLPLGVYARLAYRGRTVVVKINDRSPDNFVYLSHAAALALGLENAGAAQIDIGPPGE